jgi:hypothetical protein
MPHSRDGLTSSRPIARHLLASTEPRMLMPRHQAAVTVGGAAFATTAKHEPRPGAEQTRALRATARDNGKTTARWALTLDSRQQHYERQQPDHHPQGPFGRFADHLSQTVMPPNPPLAAMTATRRAVNRPACAPRRYSTATRSAYWGDWLLYRNRQSAGPSSSHLTHRWREVDSNFRFRARLHYGRGRVSRFTWAV